MAHCVLSFTLYNTDKTKVDNGAEIGGVSEE